MNSQQKNHVHLYTDAHVNSEPPLGPRNCAEQLEWRHLFYRKAPKSSKNKKNILRTFPLVRNFPLKVATNFLEHSFWCVYRKGVAAHAYLNCSGHPNDPAVLNMLRGVVDSLRVVNLLLVVAIANPLAQAHFPGFCLHFLLDRTIS